VQPPVESAGLIHRPTPVRRQRLPRAAHPLALQRIVVQVALADLDADSESLRAACERVLASGAKQVRIIEALLTLSRGQAGLDKREPFDLATRASKVLHARQSDAQDRQLAIRTPSPRPRPPATRGWPSA
jgi:signal transduction histidine kinase